MKRREALPDWVEWIARDADGTWWGYEHEPNANDFGWYENESGRYVCIEWDPAPGKWRESLRRIG